MSNFRVKEEKQKILKLVKNKLEVDSVFLELIMTAIFPIRKNEKQKKCYAVIETTDVCTFKYLPISYSFNNNTNLVFNMSH